MRDIDRWVLARAARLLGQLDRARPRQTCTCR